MVPSFTGPCNKDWAPEVLRVHRGSQTSDRGREGSTTENVNIGNPKLPSHLCSDLLSLQGGGEVETEED